MKRMLFVFNPNSGKTLIKNKLVEILDIFAKGGYEVTVHPTQAPKDGYDYIVQNGADYDTIVCSGGDGTLNETVGAVMKFERKIPIGYIPSGSTNDFASSLGIPKSMIDAAKNVISGKIFSCDIGMTNDNRNFNYVAAFGAFTEVSYETPQQLKNILGHQAYILEGVKSLVGLKACKVKVKSDDLVINGKFIYGMVSNTSSVGGIKGISGSEVDLSDGLFEVVLIKEIRNAIDMQQLVNAFITQNYQDADIIYSFKTKHIEFEFENDIPWTLDGEFGGKHKNIQLDVIESAVNLIIPKNNSENL